MPAPDDRPASPAEIAERLDARRRGIPFLIYRGPQGEQRIAFLEPPATQVTVGRRDNNDIVLSWDPNVSRVHAELEAVAGEWALVDDGLSRNGSFLNGQRVVGRKRLRDSDVITVGVPSLVYRASDDRAGSTATHAPREAPQLTETQRRALVALCRPCVDPAQPPAPATNRQIADELFLGPPPRRRHTAPPMTTSPEPGLLLPDLPPGVPEFDYRRLGLPTDSAGWRHGERVLISTTVPAGTDTPTRGACSMM